MDRLLQINKEQFISQMQAEFPRALEQVAEGMTARSKNRSKTRVPSGSRTIAPHLAQHHCRAPLI